MRLLLSVLPTDQGESVESIVILGRGLDNRTDRALVASQLWNDRQSSNIFVSGMTDAPPIIETLQEMGVPEAQVKGERCSQSTWENGLFSNTLLDAQKRILLVTDEPHMVRAFLVFQGFGFDVTPYPIPLESANLFSLESAKVTLREYIALIIYGVRGRFHARSAEKQQVDRVEADYKIETWHCYLQ
ncbi:MAG: YdcF family protein [Cyanobacteria bacterium J06639_14]